MLKKLAELHLAPRRAAVTDPPVVADGVRAADLFAQQPRARGLCLSLPAGPDRVGTAASRCHLAALPPELLASVCAKLTAGELLQGIAVTGPLLGEEWLTQLWADQLGIEVGPRAR